MYGGVQLPVLSRVNKIIIIAYSSIFLLSSVINAISGISLNSFLGLSISNILKGNVLVFASYPFIGTGLMEVIFNSLILWFIGSELETSWGKSRYIKFLLATVFGGALIYLLLSFVFLGGSGLTLVGMTGAVSALLVAYAILYPDKTFLFMMLFPVKAKYFCMLLIGIQLYLGIFSPMFVLAWGHLGAIASGVLFMVYISNVHKVHGSKKLKRKKRGNLHIVSSIDDDSDNPPKYWH